MNNFLELTGIKPKLNLQFYYKIHKNLICEVKINEHLCSPGMNKIKIDLLEPIVIEATIFDKIDNESALEITHADVNGYIFLPLYMHLSNYKNCWHNEVGTWKYSIDKPFYVWYHEVSGQGWIA